MAAHGHAAPPRRTEASGIADPDKSHATGRAVQNHSADQLPDQDHGCGTNWLSSADHNKLVRFMNLTTSPRDHVTLAAALKGTGLLARCGLTWLDIFDLYRLGAPASCAARNAARTHQRNSMSEGAE